MRKDLIVKYCVSILVFAGILCIFKFAGDNLKNKNIESFRNGEILICHKTLIISDKNWRLSDNYLINNNSAGYINIENCEIKD